MKRKHTTHPRANRRTPGYVAFLNPQKTCPASRWVLRPNGDPKLIDDWYLVESKTDIRAREAGLIGKMIWPGNAGTYRTAVNGPLKKFKRTL